jgi:hypothetical protein
VEKGLDVWMGAWDDGVRCDDDGGGGLRVWWGRWVGTAGRVHGCG